MVLNLHCETSTISEGPLVSTRKARADMGDRLKAKGALGEADVRVIATKMIRTTRIHRTPRPPLRVGGAGHHLLTGATLVEVRVRHANVTVTMGMMNTPDAYRPGTCEVRKSVISTSHIPETAVAHQDGLGQARLLANFNDQHRRNVTRDAMNSGGSVGATTHMIRTGAIVTAALTVGAVIAEIDTVRPHRRQGIIIGRRLRTDIVPHL